jgi:hypothetical protein
MFTFPINFLKQGGSVPSPISAEFLTASTAGAATTYTLTSIPFGTATSDRLIVVMVNGHRAATRTVTSATIGGVTATIHMNHGTSVTQLAIFSAVVPTGTSGTVVIAWSGDQADIRYAVYSIKGYVSTTPSLTDQIINTSVAPTSTISPAANTAVLAHAISFTGAGAATTTWSGTAGLVKSNDTSSVNTGSSSAFKVFSSSATNVTITATPTVGTSERRMQVIGWT